MTRLADQKGIDLLLAALTETIRDGMQFVMLGSGSMYYEELSVRMAERNSTKVGVQIGYDHALAHQIEAGCDFYLMPSRFEPCGLNQLYSLRYGTIPIVRRTGGLDDTVIDAVDGGVAANGIKFGDPTPSGLVKAIRKSLTLFENKELVTHYRIQGIAADFSWEQSVRAYERVYKHEL